MKNKNRNLNQRCFSLEGKEGMRLYLKQNEITKVCLLAGKVMLQSGAETYRVEDTMVRIALSYGMKNPQAYATPTAIMFAIDMVESANFIRIDARETDLKKVTSVNRVSRHISAGMLTVEEAFDELNQISHANESFPDYLKYLAAAIVSGCFTIMFQGSWTDFLPAVIAGGLSYYMVIAVNNYLKIRFFAEFLASMILTLLAFLFVTIGFGVDIDKIIIGAIMPLVPGLLITNAVRDLMAGHQVSGITKGAEAIITAFAIGAGVAIVLLLVY